MVASCVAPLVGAANRAEDEVVLLPQFRVEETTLQVRWRYATCEGFEILSDQSEDRTKLFATEFATFLRFARKVCPELLLPEGTQLSIILAGPANYADLAPLYPSPLGFAELPWGILARTQDTAVMAMRYEGMAQPTEYVGIDGVVRPLTVTRDADARDTLIRAQATYLNDPTLVAHRQAVRTGPPPALPFIVAVGESRPFLAGGQPFLKSGVLAVVAGMSSAVKQEYSYHDQRARWSQYFPQHPAGTQELWQHKLPIGSLPPLENLFAIDVDSPAWSSPLHRLERDALVHWALLANGSERARTFLDFLARSGAEPVTPAQFAETFGGTYEEVSRRLMKYIDSRGSDRGAGLPSRNFWNTLQQKFPDAGTTYVSRAATLEESARIRADFLRLVDKPEAAQRALSPRFKKNQLNDHIWITTGLMMLEQRDAAGALESFSTAVALGTRRPLPYVELAQLHLRLALVRRAGKKELSLAEAQRIYAFLREAEARPPALRATPSLLCDLIEWSAGTPEPAWIELLEKSMNRWPYETGLLARAASVLAQKGERARASEALGAARRSTFNRSSQAKLDRLAATLAGSDSPGVATENKTKTDLGPTALAPERGEGAFTIPNLRLEMVRVLPGIFRMGGETSDPYFKFDQQPATEVTITRGFWMGKTEVTQRQWREVVGTALLDQLKLECPDLPSNGVGDELPMYFVSWHEAADFCERLTRRERSAGRISEGFEYRLPTEAQWEYACRAGTREPFFGDPAAVAWLPVSLPPRWVIPFNNVTFVPAVKRVASKQPNPWGLYDMYGNVSEWCLDWYAPALPGGQVADPVGPREGAYRVVRGGSCWGVEVGVPIIGSAVRSKDRPTARFARGFRPVLVEKVD
ncbi:MAG: formylglycine-generating enzyme family protein [Opitutaceae bacterium]